MQVKRGLRRTAAFGAAAILVAFLGSCSQRETAGVTLLNASYSSTRELYNQYNAAFEKYWNK